MGIYWVDFKLMRYKVDTHGNMNIRVSLEAHNEKEATEKAKSCLGMGYGHIKTQCVR